MGPPPSSGPLEPDNLQELRTTMEPIRDAVPQRSLTTTPASTTAGHAPDRGVGVQSGQKCPLCSSAREYRQGRPVHKGRTTARQVRPYAWPGHRTHISMQDQRLHAPQGRADVSPEHGWGGLSRQALNFHPQICGTRGGYVSGVKYVSLWQTCDMYIPGKPRCVQ